MNLQPPKHGFYIPLSSPFQLLQLYFRHNHLLPRILQWAPHWSVCFLSYFSSLHQFASPRSLPKHVHFKYIYHTDVSKRLHIISLTFWENYPHNLQKPICMISNINKAIQDLTCLSSSICCLHYVTSYSLLWLVNCCHHSLRSSSVVFLQYLPYARNCA